MQLLNSNDLKPGMWLCIRCMTDIPTIEGFSHGIKNGTQHFVKVEKVVDSLFSFYIEGQYKIIPKSMIKNGVYVVEESFFSPVTITYNFYVCSKGEVPIAKRMWHSFILKGKK